MTAISNLLASLANLFSKLAGFIAGWLAGTLHEKNKDLARENRVLQKQVNLVTAKRRPAIERLRDNDL